MKQGSITFPLPPGTAWRRLKDKGLRPHNQPEGVKTKTYDTDTYYQRITIRLPIKHASDTDLRTRVEKALNLPCFAFDIRRQNQKWVGVTVTLDLSGLKALGC